MAKLIIPLLTLVLLVLTTIPEALACTINDCNSIDSVGLDDEKKHISNFFEEYLGHATIPQEGKTILYIETDDGTVSDSISIHVGETKTFHGETITLLKAESVWIPGTSAWVDISTFVKGGLPACFEYCYPVRGDSYCGMNEETTYHLDCDSEYCGNGVCEDYDRGHCHEDCAEEFCGDSQCEDFEVGICLSDCTEASIDGSFNYGGYILKDQKYEIDDEHSIMFINTNFNTSLKEKGIDQKDLKATFKIFKGDDILGEFELKKIDPVTQPIKDVDYAFSYGGNNPNEERAELDIYKVKEIKNKIKLNSREGFFCEDIFITLLKSTLLYPDPFYPPVMFQLLSMSEEGWARIDLVTCNDCVEDLDKPNNELQERQERFTCDDLVPTIQEFSLEDEYVVLAFPLGSFEPDECESDLECDDDDPSTEDSCFGTPRKCFNTFITGCLSGDGYCPQDCSYGIDTDCAGPDQCAVDAECDDGDPCTADRCGGAPKKCINEITQAGCDFEENCVPIGTRVFGRYCSADNQLRDQQIKGTGCSSDYECASNRCADSRCKKQNLIQRILGLLKRLF